MQAIKVVRGLFRITNYLSLIAERYELVGEVAQSTKTTIISIYLRQLVLDDKERTDAKLTDDLLR